MTSLGEITRLLRERFHLDDGPDVAPDRAITRVVTVPAVSAAHAVGAAEAGADLVVAYDATGLYASAAARPLAPVDMFRSRD